MTKEIIYNVEGLTNHEVRKIETSIKIPKSVKNLDEYIIDSSVDFRDYIPEFRIILNWKVVREVKKIKYKKFQYSRIIGILDNDNTCKSVFISYESDNQRTHADIYGDRELKRWRWDLDRGIDFSVYSIEFDKHDHLIITDHLRRKYGLPYNNKGRLDWQFMKENWT